jgi:hypothetical protein
LSLILVTLPYENIGKGSQTPYSSALAEIASNLDSFVGGCGKLDKACGKSVESLWKACGIVGENPENNQEL